MEPDVTLWGFTLWRNPWYLVYVVSVVNQTVHLALKKQGSDCRPVAGQCDTEYVN